jgi:hypothetical protein
MTTRACCAIIIIVYARTNNGGLGVFPSHPINTYIWRRRRVLLFKQDKHKC